MSITSRVANAAKALWGYEAADGTGSQRRTQSVVTTLSEDNILTQQRRGVMISTTRDLQRNMTIAGWAIRRHLDYVSTFTFQARTGNPGLNKLLETRVKEWSEPDKFDALHIMNRQNFVRTMESCRTLDGDILVMKLRDGHIQAIESDRIRNPDNSTSSNNWNNGVEVDDAGIIKTYGIWKRTKYGVVFDKNVSASVCFPLFAYRPRFDSVRGISPLAPAINSFVDLGDSITYALSKMKLSQLFGLVFTRNSGAPLGVVTPNDPATPAEGYSVDFKKGPVLLNLRPGDEAKFLESQTPSQEFQNFVGVTIPMCLKALDIPYSFYDESYTNYSGARQALLQYESSADVKRLDIIAFLNRWTAWRMSVGVLDGEIPPSIPFLFEWVPTGLPWIDPLKESSANMLEVGLGTKSRTMVCKERGYEFDDVLAELIDENTKLESAGMKPTFPTMQINVSTGDEPDNKPAPKGK